MSGLPDGWIDAVMEDFADIQLGKMLDKTKNKGDPTPYLRNINVRWGSFDLSDVLEMRFTPEERVFFSIEDNDLIVCEGGEPGRAAIWRAGPTVLKYQKALHRVRLSEWVMPDFVYYFLLHASKRGLLESFLTGTTIKHLPRNAFLRVNLPLPPTNEQRRIVDKLDSLFERTRRAREELSHIPRLIENYKKAILAAAFSGKWFRQAWDYVGFSEIIASAQNGLSKRSGDRGRPVYVMRLSDLSDGRFVGDDPRSIFLDEKEVETYALGDGDLMCVRVNGSEHLVGRMFVWSKSEQWAFCDHFIRFKLHADIADAAFVAWYFSTDHVRRQIETTFVSSAGQKTVSQRTLGTIKVPMPGIKTQRETVRRIEKAMEWLRVVETEQGLAANLLDHLDQAHLAKAFRGELVPQDPNDEPASVLLNRIGAARAEQPKKTRKGRGKTANASVAA